MQANQTPVVWTVVIAALVLLVVSLFTAGGINSNLKLLGEKLDGFDVDEDAIVSGVLEGIEVPEYPEFPEFDELWEGIYSDKITDLENEAQDVAKDQFREDNEGFEYDEGEDAYFFYEDDELFEFLEDEYDDESEGLIRVQFFKEYEGKREINVINLGLDDEDDREVELSSVIRVKIFTDEHDDTEYVFDKVYIDSIVTSDDGDLEAEIIYSL